MADTLDVITLAEAHQSINLADAQATQDTKLARFVTGISRRLDILCGPIVNRTITSEVHDGGRVRVRLFKKPVSSVTTVVEWSAGTGTTMTAETTSAAGDYLLDSTYGVLFRRAGWCDSTWLCGRQNVIVTYVAGRAANTGAVDALFKNAAGLILQHLWRPSSGAWAQSANPYGEALPDGPPLLAPWAVPRAVLELLADQLQTNVVA